MALSHVVSKMFNVEHGVTLKSGSEVTQGHQHWTDRSATYDFLL